jgi:hypothetical protein
MCNTGESRKPRAIANGDMVGYPCHPTDRNEIAQYYASRNSNLSRDYAMPANARVVTDLHEIIDFRPLTDHSVAQRGTVNGGIRANLNPVLNDDAPELRNLPVPVGA